MSDRESTSWWLLLTFREKKNGQVVQHKTTQIIFSCSFHTQNGRYSRVVSHCCNLQQIALPLSSVWDNGSCNFSESQGTSLTWRRSPGDCRDILGKGLVGFLVSASWILPPKRVRAVSQTLGWKWNKLDKWVLCPWDVNLNPFSHHPRPEWLGRGGRGWSDVLTSLRSPVWSEGYLLAACSPPHSWESGGGRAREMAENWRPQGRLARHPSMRSRDWKLSCCNYRLWNRCGTH